VFAWLSNLRLHWKVLFAPGFLILVLLGFGAYALHMQQSNQATVNALMDGPVRQAEAVADFGATAWASEVHLYRLMATAANETDEKKIKALSDRASAALADAAAKFKTLEALGTVDSEAAETIAKLKAAVADYAKRARGVIDMADSDSGTALMLMQGAAQSFAVIERLTAALNETSKAVRDGRIAKNNAELERQKRILIGVMLGALVAGCLASLLISRGIAKPVVGIAGAIRRMAQGDFDLALPGLGRKDEIGEIAAAVEALKQAAVEKVRGEAEEAAARQTREAEIAAQQQRNTAELQAKAAEERAKAAEEQAQVLKRLAGGLKSLSDGDLTVCLGEGFSGAHQQIRDDFNSTARRLHETIRAISELARDVSTATTEISTSTTHLSERTEEQAASLEETAASMEEIAAAVKKNAQHAQEANRSAGNTRAVADRGGQVVAKAVEAMAKIEESSRKISDIIGVIDEIARQTNLLALNAAVEAARAGEAGRGFAVVASEVRNLAQRSSQAAKDIKELITNSNSQVQDGVDLVNRAGAALAEIVASIKDVAEVVAHIAKASAAQANGIEQVNKALTRMDEVTQQNSALVEENAATTKTLERQARAMDERVAFFKLAAAEKTSAAVPVRKAKIVAATPSRESMDSALRALSGDARKAAGGRAATAIATAVKREDWQEF
jgi:methyl-accepting chemotaxis protein